MLEQLARQIQGTSFQSTGSKQKAAGLVTNATGRLAALGVNTATLDVGAASSVQQALGIARATVAAQSFSSTEAKQRALGEIDRLATEITSALNS